jgi:hypothetical protein
MANNVDSVMSSAVKWFDVRQDVPAHGDPEARARVAVTQRDDSDALQVLRSAGDKTMSLLTIVGTARYVVPADVSLLGRAWSAGVRVCACTSHCSHRTPHDRGSSAHSAVAVALTRCHSSP